VRACQATPITTGSGKTGDDRDLLVSGREVQDARKAVEHQRATDAIAPHERESERMLGDAEHRAFERPSK
jgi:hypothetical protein